MAIDHRAWASSDVTLRGLGGAGTLWPDDGWIVVRLAMLPWPLPDHSPTGTDPSILRRLASGDAASAVERAVQRLRSARVNPLVREASVSPETARLWAAALAFPINQSTAVRLLRRIEPNETKERTV